MSKTPKNARKREISPAADQPLLVAEGVSKSFSGVPALREGRLLLKRGTVHALCGGNGAGKSTFLNILMGLLRRDEGLVRIEGEAVEFKSAAEALDHGIAIITQELSPIEHMTVAENLYLGREPHIGKVIVNFPQMAKNAAALLSDLGFDVPAKAKMSELSLAQIQLVEIAKALSYDAQIVIMDEPTTAIGEHEVHILFDALRRIKARGAGIIYVSHKLTEIFEIADEYTVFRDGRFIETGRIDSIDRKHLVTQIVGHEVTMVEKGEPISGARPLLEVRNLSGEHFRDISLQVPAGEVLGIYGLLGAGRTPFVETIYGTKSPTSGEVILDGSPVPARNPKRSIRLGMSLVSEDRKVSGLVLIASVADNITLSSVARRAVCCFVNQKAEAEVVQNMIQSQRIKASSPNMAVESLSGGNQQKVVFARCLTTNPKLLICDEPTRGIDEGSKQEIYSFLRKYAAKGHAVLVVSSEAPEILQVSDRIAIFKKGRLSEIVDGRTTTQRALMDLAS
jgi:putative xylitol transport system ATP-binding protein